MIRAKGYYGTGLAEILNATSVPKGSLYHHFPLGKDELVIEALSYSAEQYARDYVRVMKGKPTPEAALIAVLDYFIERLEGSNFRQGCPLATVSLDIAADNDGLRQRCAELFGYWLDSMESYLRYKGVPDAKPKSEAFFTGLEGALMLSLIHHDARFLEQFKFRIPDIIDT